MNVQAARTELAALAPEGVKGYDYFPGSAELPAMVVGLPERIEFGRSMKQAEVTLPITVLVPGNAGVEAETNLMTKVVAVATAVRSASPTHLIAPRITEIRDYGLRQIGSAQAFGAEVAVTFLLNNF